MKYSLITKILFIAALPKSAGAERDFGTVRCSDLSYVLMSVRNETPSEPHFSAALLLYNAYTMMV